MRGECCGDPCRLPGVEKLAPEQVSVLVRKYIWHSLVDASGSRKSSMIFCSAVVAYHRVSQARMTEKQRAVDVCKPQSSQCPNTSRPADIRYEVRESSPLRARQTRQIRWTSPQAPQKTSTRTEQMSWSYIKLKVGYSAEHNRSIPSMHCAAAA